MDGIKQLAKNEKEVKTLMQTIRTLSQDIGMEFDIKNVLISLWKVRKEKQWKG